jgi:SAM-dependent methyltransferase
VNQSTLNPNERRLAEWHRSPLGALLASHERHVLRPAVEDVFGLHLLQIGLWGELGRLLSGARTQRQAVLGLRPNGAAPAASREGRATEMQVCAKPSELPVASDTVDGVILPHTLEFEADPYAVLREVQRVLVGDGRLLILGFLPAGPWAWRHRFSSGGFPPGLVRLISERRLREWLALLGFEVGAARRYLPRLPLSPPPGVAPDIIRENPIALRLFGSCYLLSARKRVYMVTPVRPRWRERRSLVGGLVEPTTRTPVAGARMTPPSPEQLAWRARRR